MDVESIQVGDLFDGARANFGRSVEAELGARDAVPDVVHGDLLVHRCCCCC